MTIQGDTFRFGDIGSDDFSINNEMPQKDNVLGLCIDEEGGVYSHDGKVLLKASDVSRYQVREGAKHLAKDALLRCRKLEHICFPHTLHLEDFDFAELEMNTDEDGWEYPIIGTITLCDKPYTEEISPWWWDDEDSVRKHEK